MSEMKPAEVEITLDGESVTLRCTLEAAIAINTHFQGFLIAYQRVSNMDIQSAAVVVRYGAGMDAKAAKDLMGKIHATGIGKLTGPLAAYISLLITGGKAAKDDESGEAGAGREGAG